MTFLLPRCHHLRPRRAEPYPELRSNITRAHPGTATPCPLQRSLSSLQEPQLSPTTASAPLTMSLKGPTPEQHDGSGLRVAIVHARWNTTVIEPLVAGAKAKLLECGVKESNIVIQSCPGAWELPIAVQRYVLVVLCPAAMLTRVLFAASSPPPSSSPRPPVVPRPRTSSLRLPRT